MGIKTSTLLSVHENFLHYIIKHTPQRAVIKKLLKNRSIPNILDYTAPKKYNWFPEILFCTTRCFAAFTCLA